MYGTIKAEMVCTQVRSSCYERVRVSTNVKLW